MLAAKNCAGRGHLVFDKRVPNVGAHGDRSGGFDRFWHDERRNEVVQHNDVTFGLDAANPLNLAKRNDRGDCRRRNRLTFLVDDETAVCVAVEGEPEVGSVFENGALQVDDIGGFERVGFVVRKRAVELEVHGDDLEGQRVETCGGAENCRHGHPTHAVSCVYNDSKRADAAEVNE